MKTLRELFEQKKGWERVIDHINNNEIRFYCNGFLMPIEIYRNDFDEFIHENITKQYAIRDKLINELMSENKELKKEIDHVKDVWIGISDAKDLIIKRLEKEK
jgi:hypothetical protein